MRIIMENWSLFYPIKIAKRYKNTKRSYLLVNCLQGKHMPVRPEKAIGLYKSLGTFFKDQYPNAKLVIGFAETATAVGFGVTKALGNDVTYLTTTREPHISDDDCICFFEEHSHATEQKIYVKEFKSLLHRTNEIIMIDDEISTGKTLLNITNELKRAFPEIYDKRIVIGSILNRITKEREDIFNQNNIYFESVFKTSVSDPELIRNGTELTAPSDEFYNAKTTDNHKPFHFAFSDVRTSINVQDYLDNCQQLACYIMEHFSFSGYKRILVLGTEECMYPAIYVARMIENKYNIEAFCHATTRSPICVSRDKKYPIQNGYIIPSFYDDKRISYIYNLQEYDAAFVISDTIRASENAITSLDKVLASYHITDRFYIIGG